MIDVLSNKESLICSLTKRQINYLIYKKQTEKIELVAGRCVTFLCYAAKQQDIPILIKSRAQQAGLTTSCCQPPLQCPWAHTINLPHLNAYVYFLLLALDNVLQAQGVESDLVYQFYEYEQILDFYSNYLGG